MTDADDVKPDAWFELTETSFVEMMWFVAFDVNGPRYDDWLAIVFQDSPGQPWRVATRYRFSEDADAWSPEDTRRGFKGIARDDSQASRDALVRTVNSIFIELRKDKRHRAHRLHVHGHALKLFRLLRKQRWMHGRMVQRGPDQPQ